MKNTDIIKKEDLKHIFCKNWTDKQIEQLAKEMLTWFENDKSNVWLIDFAIEKHISRQRISEFAKRNKFFANAYQHCKEIQESRIVKLGLSGKHNPAFVIFFLKNHFRWSDKPEITDFPENIKLLLEMTGIEMQQNI